MKIVINSVIYPLIFIYTSFSLIVCESVSSDESLDSKSFLIKNLDNGKQAVDIFYDVYDLEESVKEHIFETVSKELKENKILKGSNDEDDVPVSVNIKNPIRTQTGQVKVDVFERITEPTTTFYSRNSSKQQMDVNEYFPTKSEDGTNVLCEDWRSVALEKQRLKSSVFIPKCNPDGSYVSEQCDDVAGICWCVNHHGEEISGTLVKFERPKCNKKSSRKGIMILASGQNLIDIGDEEEEMEGFKCEKEKRSLEKLRTYFNETTQRIRIPVCEDDDYAPIQCTTSKKHCWCVTRNGDEIAKSGKVGIKPINCSVHREVEKENVEVTHDWPHLWKVISEWLTSARIMSQVARQDNARYVYKPRGVLVKLPQSSGFKKSMIFLPQESPDNDTEIPYNVWLKIMKNENSNFDAHSYEVDNKEMSKYQSIEVPDGKGNYYLITVSDFLKIYPTFEDLWKKVKRNASEFEMSVKKQQLIDWKKLSEQPKSETSDPNGILAAGTFEMRSEQKICFCYNKRYWQKLQRFIGENRTTSTSGEPKIHGRSITKSPVEEDQRLSSRGCKTVCIGARHGEMGNVALMEGLTINDVMESDLSPEKKTNVDRIIRERISKVNPMRNLLQMNIEHFESLSGIEFNNIQIPLRYFSLQFWHKLSEYTKEPLPSIEQNLGFKMNEDLEQSGMGSRKPKAINLGKLIRLMSKSNLNTKQVLELAGYSTRTIVDGLENTLFIAIRGSLKAISVPYKVIKGYFMESRPVTKITSTAVNSEPDGVAGTVSFRSGICNFGFSVASFVKSVPEYVKDVQIYFGDSQKCTTNCPTFNNDLTHYIKNMASLTNTVSFAMQINFGARIYRQVPFYIRLYVRKALRRAGFAFLIASEAHIEMVYQTVAMLSIAFVKPFVKIPYILLLGEGGIIDRVLGSFPAVIELTGDLLKPLMVITEPLLRALLFLNNGDFQGSLNAGRGQSEYFDRNVMTAFNGRPVLLENYKPYTVRRGQIMGPDGIPMDVERKEDEDNESPPEQQSMLVTPDVVRKVEVDPNDDMLPVQTTVDPDEVETTFLDRYHGITPEKGYSIDSNRFPVYRETRVTFGLISRIVKLPFFLLMAGGPIFGPAANLVTPFINTTMLFLYSNLHIYEKVRKVPDILEASSAFFKPITMVLNAVLPIIDLLYDFWTGNASVIQTTARAPIAFMSLATSPLKFFITAPTSMAKEASQYFTGSNGLLSMFSLQFSESFIGNRRGYIFRRAQEGYSRAKVYAARNPKQDNFLFVATYMGLYYLKPHLDVISSLFNGGIGNVIDANKVYQYEFLSWGCDPYISMVKLSQNQAAMYEVAVDKNIYVQSVLGGEDPDELRVVGIDASKLIQTNIDPMNVLLGGQQPLPVILGQKPNESQLNRIGIDENNLQRIGLSYKQLMSGGLWNAKQDVLLEYGIDPFLLVNRMMRNSIVNKRAFLRCGISVRKMLSVGIRPDYFLAAGVSAISSKIWRNLGINPTRYNDAFAFFKIGISFDTLDSLHVNPVKLVENGVAGFNDSVVRFVFGIDKQKLISSVYLGFNEASLLRVGIHAKKMIRAGYSPIDLVTGSPTLFKMSDEQLLQNGLDVRAMRSSDLKPRSILRNGIMSTDMYKFNRLGVNADEMLAQLYSKSGVGLLANNEYSRRDNVYVMSTAVVDIAKKNGVPEFQNIYYFLTKEKRSVFVIAKEKAYDYVGLRDRGFISWVILTLISIASSLIEWFIFYLPSQVLSFFRIMCSTILSGSSILGQAMG